MRKFTFLFIVLCAIKLNAQENLTVSTNTLLVDAGEKSTNWFNVNSISSWTSSSNQSWLTLQPSSFDINPDARPFLATGVRVHPTAGNYPFNNLSEILTLVSTNPTIVTKPKAGDWTFKTQIEITNNTILVGGKTMNKVLVSIIDPANTTGTGMLDTDQNGQATNYFDPSTKTYYLSYFYNTVAPRKIYETVTAAPSITSVQAIAQENPTSSTREATITISAIGITPKTITVTQAASPVLSVSASSVTIAAAANSAVSFQLKSTTSWTIASNQSWLTVNKENGSGSSNVELIAIANSAPTQRSATVTVSVQGITKLINVTQYGALPSSVAWNQYYSAKSYSGISVVNENVIWLCGSSDKTIAYTIDGGTTWTSKLLPIHLPSNTGFCAVSQTTAYITSADSVGLWKTTDGATTWTLEPTGFRKINPTNFYGASFPNFVYFWDVNNGITYGDDNEIYITNNAGIQWNLVTWAKSTSASSEWSISSQASYRVVGDAIYILVTNQANTNRILVSHDKGTTWSSFNAPSNTMNASFDFKDANNGLFVDYNINPSKLYSTSNGGLNWTLINSTETLGYLKFIPNQNMYISTNKTNGAKKTSEGIKYSTNNGVSWTKHPSFTNTYNENMAFTSRGTTYIAGSGYVYSTTNIVKVNTSLDMVEVKTPTSIDLTFSANIDLTSAQDTSHYLVSFKNASNTAQHLKVVSAQRDNLNPSLVHLTLQYSLPEDTISIQTINLYDANGFPLINGGELSSKSIIYKTTSIDDQKDSKYLIYPNPVVDYLKIEGFDNQSVISIFNVEGREMIHQNLENNHSVWLGSLQAGQYIVRIVNANTVRNYKITKR